MRAKITDRFIKDGILKASALPGRSYPPLTDVEVRDISLPGFVLIVRSTSVLSFCVRYRNASGLAKKFTIGKYGAITTTKARQIAQKRLGEVKAGIDIQADRILSRREAKRAQLSTLRGFLDNQYADWLKTERRSGTATLARIQANFGGWYERPLQDINSWLVTSWRTKKLKDGARTATVNRDIGALKSLMSKAIEWEVLEEHPLRELKPLKNDKNGVIRYLNESEELQLRKALDARQEKQRTQRRSFVKWQLARGRQPLPLLDDVQLTDHLKPIVLLALNTGMRRGEIFGLRWKDVSFEQRNLVVRGDGAKSGNSRVIPLNAEAHELLDTWHRQSTKPRNELVFPSPVTRRRMTTIKTGWAELLRLSKIEDLRFHDLRHTFASNLAMRGADLYSIKELLGHANIETTQKYAHLAPEHKSRIVELLSQA